jgi:hypothetical protein
LEHLREAKERNAGILDIGDLHCAMQGKWDKRSDRSHLREPYRSAAGSYLDTLVSEASNFYEPFADRWILMTPGNHETAILKKHETDLTARTVERLKDKAPHLHAGAYTGWVRFMCQRSSTVRQFAMHYHHGYGGGGPVTRDVIQTNRKAVYLPDADIVWSGHTHDSWHLPIARERLCDRNGATYYDQQVHVKTAGYKRSHAQHGGWEAEKGFAPKNIGAYWIRFFWKGDGVEFELTEAK